MSFSKISSIKLILVLNLVLTLLIGFWVYKQDGNSIKTEEIETLLQDIAENDPQFFVSLLNESANDNAEDNQEDLEKSIFSRKDNILKAGFTIKASKEKIHKTLVVFADMTSADCLTYLKNIELALPKLECSVRIIPISIFGGKANGQARLIKAASLQNIEKAFQLALLYNPIEGAENNVLVDAEKLGFDTKKLQTDQESKEVQEDVSEHTKMTEDLEINIPGIFLLTSDSAYAIAPAEAIDIPKQVEDPLTGISNSSDE